MAVAVAKSQTLIFSPQGAGVLRALESWLCAPRAQATNPAAGRRGNNLCGAAEGPSEWLTFPTDCDRAQSVELFTQVLPAKVEFFLQDKLIHR